MRRLSCLLAVLLVGWAVPVRARSLGAIEAELGQLESSLEQYIRALRLPRARTERDVVRRYLDGLVLFRMGDYDKAASVFVDIVTNYKQSRVAPQAEFYLAECLFRRREYHSAARHYRAVVDRGPGVENYQRALQRLLEIAFRKGRSENVYSLIQKVQAVPKAQRDPAMEYVLGKYFYFRGLLDRAAEVFRSLDSASLYGLRGRYFLGVIAVRKKQRDKAESIFKALVADLRSRLERRQGPVKLLRRLKDLTVLALARLYYTKDDPDAAIALYRTISRRSPYFEEALHELAWAYLRAWEFYRAINTLELLVILSPNSRYVTESKLMIGNLRVVARDYESAKKLFRSAARRFRPIYLKLRALRRRRLPPEQYVAVLTKRHQRALDVDLDVPREVVSEVESEPQVRKALALVGDLDEIKAGIRECEALWSRVARRLHSPARVVAFPEVAKGRLLAASVGIRLANAQRELSDMLAKKVLSSATGAERAELEEIRRKKERLASLVEAMPRSASDLRKRAAAIRKLYSERETEAHKLAVAIDGLEAMLVAVANYFESTRAKQKLAPEVVRRKIRALGREIASLRRRLRAIQAEIDDGKSSAGLDEETLGAEKRIRREYDALLTREQAILEAVLSRLSADRRLEAERILAVMRRARRVASLLADYNRRLDSLLAFKLGEAERVLAEEKANIERYKRLVQTYGPEAKDVLGAVAQAGFQRAADSIRQLLLRADVGILDVAWALKSDRSEDWAAFVRREAKRLQDLDKRFQEVRAQ